MEELEVIEILSTAYDGDEFPGYENIRLSFSQLETIIRNKRSGEVDDHAPAYSSKLRTFTYRTLYAQHSLRYSFREFAKLSEYRYKTSAGLMGTDGKRRAAVSL